MSRYMVRYAISAAALCCAAAQAQLILNEGNAVGPSGLWIESDLAKPYEGFDYGVIPHSGNIESPLDPVSPGNPFPDVDAAEPGVQTELANGWTIETGWARIAENGGDWIELVVTEDFTDLRGYWLYWESDENDNGVVGEDDTERGYVRLTNDPLWAALRAGTIITISEDDSAAEVRDGFPLAPPGTHVHDTGYVYDLSTDTHFDPIGVRTLEDALLDTYAGDWTIHLRLDEDVTVDQLMDTQWFKGGSDLRVDNDDWRLWIFDATNPGPVSDKTTGLVQSAIGESSPVWGDISGGGGINSQEIITLVFSPVSGLSAAYYEDVDFSSFGRPNVYNAGTEATPDGVQDFSLLWEWLATILPGDTNFDSEVDFADARTTLGNLTGPGGADDLPWSGGSFDGDGDGDLLDVVALQRSFGS